MSAIVLSAAMVLLSCSPTPAAAPASAPPASAQPTSAQPAPAAHPGQIVFVDADGTEKTRPATEVPESIAWGTVGDQRIPVIRVVRITGGGRDEITRYGPGGQEIDRTITAPPP